MNILNDLPDMVQQGILTEDSAERVRAYYQARQKGSGNRLFLVFGILGSLLVGLGLFLIIAHNWDELSIGMKTFFAFLPLVAGLGAGGYSLWKTPDSKAWREASAAFLVIAVGVCLALIQQIYQLPDDIGLFMLKWMIMALPIAYVMGSSMASLLFFVGITFLSTTREYGLRWDAQTNLAFWPLLLAGLPFYVLLARKRPESNFTSFHHWVVPASIALGLASLARHEDEMMMLSYFSLFSFFVLVGELPSLLKVRIFSGGYTIIGSIGLVVLMLIYSFAEPWDEMNDPIDWVGVRTASYEWIGALVFSLASLGLLGYHVFQGKLKVMNPLAPVFILFISMFLIGVPEAVGAAVFNFLILAISVIFIVRGAKNDHLGTLNLGMLIMSILILCRFFDADLSFVVRGILFVILGAGFFAVNFFMISKRKQNGK